ncbi:SMI1/KNR4 family protein [Actinomadura verrucosospora]|uniref:Knr4/Smi1-like domain-containing protein n=1 Tax=Actinomadura verrucosospora TaxID=46165 RepID=A0A7D4A7Y4_ACTVE|nr:SMI1/KNR4 family protein [Actinomadura verrucosospora]QKG23367.1 hypothetical protein ACTIVE_5010 [Actinomadura verrucosospora]
MGFDIVRDLPPALHDRAAAWTFIREFAGSWGLSLGREDGTPDGELAEAEERLGLRLPAAVREAYALFGRRPDLHSNLDTLLSPGELAVEHGALVFREENQGAARWGVLRDDLAAADPPVHVRQDLADKYAELWEPWTDRFSTAVLEIVMAESTQGPEELCDGRDLGPGEDDELARRFTLVPFPAESGQNFFTAPGLLMSDGGGAWLSVRARDPETLDRFRRTFPGDWVNA